MRRTLWIALALSCAAHLFLLSYFGLGPPIQLGNAPQPDALILELELRDPDVRLAEPPVEAESLVQEVPATKSDVTTEPDPMPAVVQALPQPDAQAPQDSVKPPTLNLSRPSNWDTLAIQPPGADPVPFQRSFSASVEQRRTEQRRAAALSRAQLARLGLPEEAFRRRTDSGEQVKTAKGCFEKRTQMTPTGLEERWWRIACKGDGQKPAWQRELLTFGADHRITDKEAQ